MVLKLLGAPSNNPEQDKMEVCGKYPPEAKQYGGDDGVRSSESRVCAWILPEPEQSHESLENSCEVQNQDPNE
jgi:hypothetical protein